MLRPYQVPHAKHLYDVIQRHHSAFDGSDTGTGKTYCALSVAKTLDVVPLVVGPLGARGGWEQASEDLGAPIEYVNYERLRGSTGRIGIAETEWLVERSWGKGSFLQWKNAPEFVIFDEVHRCGGATTLNSKSLIAARRQCKYVLALSATAADDPVQMKALGFTLGLHGLSKQTRLLPNYINWLMRHGCTPGVFGGFKFSQTGHKQIEAFKRLHQEIFPAHGGRMRRAEIPEFPDTVVDIKLLSDSSDTASGVASELHTLNEEKGKKDLAGIIHLRQKLELLKVPCLLDLAKDYVHTSKVVIFVNFTASRVELYNGLCGIFSAGNVGELYGEQPQSERRQIIEDFQANRLAVLVSMSQVGAESINLHDPKGVVERTSLISPCEGGRQFKQLLGRVHRDGGARSLQLTVYFKGTYEEKVAARLRQKGMNIDLLNDGDFEV